MNRDDPDAPQMICSDNRYRRRRSSTVIEGAEAITQFRRQLHGSAVALPARPASRQANNGSQLNRDHARVAGLRAGNGVPAAVTHAWTSARDRCRSPAVIRGCPVSRGRWQQSRARWRCGQAAGDGANRPLINAEHAAVPSTMPQTEADSVPVGGSVRVVLERPAGLHGGPVVRRRGAAPRRAVAARRYCHAPASNATATEAGPVPLCHLSTAGRAATRGRRQLRPRFLERRSDR